MASYLQFRVGEQYYAIPVIRVLEVIHLVEVTPVPDQPKHHLGVITLRGQVIPVIDLPRRFTQHPAQLQLTTPMIAIRIKNQTVALVVDEVHNVFELNNTIENSPEPTVDGVVRVQDKMIILPNMENLI